MTAAASPAIEPLARRVAAVDPTLGLELHTLFAALSGERDAYRAAYELARLELERLRRHLFGKKGERVDPAQLQLVFAAFQKLLDEARARAQDTAGEGAAMPPAPPPKPRSRHGRRQPADLAELPEVRLEIPDPTAGPDAVRIGEDVSTKVEWQRGHFVRAVVVRPRHARPTTESEAMTTGARSTVIVADPVAEIVPRGMLGPGLIAKILVDKYCDHIPFHRQEDQMARQGVTVDRATMSRYAKAFAAHAEHIVAAMHADALAHAHVIATDATGILVQAPEKCRRGHFWVAIADREHVFFRYTPRATSDAVRSFLGGYKGHVQADAASVYDALFAEGPTEVGCWSHARRHFHECMGVDSGRAMTAVGFIDELFRIERRIRDAPPQQRLAVRKTHSRVVLDHLYAWSAEQERLLDADRSPILRSFGYLRRHREALCRFVEDPKLRIDNNPSELALRHLVLGRKNWLFVGSDTGGETTATIVSLVSSARLHQIEPWEYFRCLCRLLPIWPRQRALELSPRDWKNTRARLRDDQMEPSFGYVDIPPPP